MPRGTARLERRWAIVDEKSATTQEARQAEAAVEEYAPTPLGAQLAALDREAERAGLFPERE